jgi:hypothetical protein
LEPSTAIKNFMSIFQSDGQMVGIQFLNALI